MQSYDYDSFGNLITQSGTSSNSYRYSTKELDSTGLIYFGARYYDPRIGRFITPDPLGIVDGPNLYLYVNNDPVNWIDAWGLCGKQLGNLTGLGTILVVLTVDDATVIGVADNILMPIIIGAAILEFSKYNKKGPLWDAPGMPGDIIRQYDENHPGAFKPPPNFKNWKDKVIWAAGLLAKLFNNLYGGR